MSKGDMADSFAEDLGKIRSTLGAVLPDDNGEIASDLMRLPERTLRGLLDVFSVLRTQDERLFEAHREWMLEDAGGASLADAITSRLGFSEWVKRKAKA